MSETRNRSPKKGEIRLTRRGKGAVMATVAGLALASQVPRIEAMGSSAPEDGTVGHGNHHEKTHHVPIKDLDKDSTVTIKVRKDETAGSIAQDLMAQPEDFTKIVDTIQDAQEYPSVLDKGTIVHLDASEVSGHALHNRRHENSVEH